MSSASRSSRRHWLVPVLLLVAISGGLVWNYALRDRITIPVVRTDGADPEVAALVQKEIEAVRKDSKSAKAWGRLGMTLLANKFDEDAVAPLEHAEAREPTNHRWPYLCGIAWLNRNPERAIQCFRRADERCNDNEQRDTIRLRLAETLLANGHNDEAEAIFNTIPEGPLSPCVEYGFGVLAFARGQTTEARRYLQRSASSPFTQRKAALQLATIARRTNAQEWPKMDALPEDVPWPDAIIETCMALATGKESRVKRATLLEQQGKAQQALEEFRALARDYPEAQSYLTLGITLGRRGLYQESADWLRKCLKEESQIVRAQYYLSLALLAQGEAAKQRAQDAQAKLFFEEAAQWAKKAVTLTPHNGEAQFQLGLCEWCLDRRAAAIEAFRQTIATRPELVDGHYWLGKALVANGQPDEALTHLRQAQTLAPNDPRAGLLIAEVQQPKKP